MDTKETIKGPYQVSPGLEALLLDPKITTSIASNYKDYELVLLQLQRDLASGKDDEYTMQVLKGLRILDIYLKMFAKEGHADLKAEGR